MKKMSIVINGQYEEEIGLEILQESMQPFRTTDTQM